MMISPEAFLDEYQDATYEELIQIREELLDDIRSFEQSERPDEDICPSPDVVYQMNLLYMAKICEAISNRFSENR